MTKGQYFLLVVTTAFFGLFGGAAASLMTSGQAAWGQKDMPYLPIVRAGRFDLVGENGETRATFGLGISGQPAIWMKDKNGTNRVDLGIQGNGQAGVEIYGPNGKLGASLGYTRFGYSRPGEISERELSDFFLTIYRDEAPVVLLPMPSSLP